MKERYYAPGQPPKGYHYKFYQDGWVLEHDDNNPIVHSNYSTSIGIASFIFIAVAVAVALAVIL